MELKQDSAWHLLLVLAKATGTAGKLSEPQLGRLKRSTFIFMNVELEGNCSEFTRTSSRHCSILAVAFARRKMHLSTIEPFQQLLKTILFLFKLQRSKFNCRLLTSSHMFNLSFLSQKEIKPGPCGQEKHLSSANHRATISRCVL